MNNNPELAFILTVLQHQFVSSANPCDECGVSLPDINWSLFYELVCRHRIWHQVYHLFNDLQLDTPITAKLAKKCHKSSLRILVTANETRRIAREFTRQSIEHCFVKGTLLNVHIYGGLNTRPCSDIDVWVNTTTYKDAVAILLSLGYQQKLPKYELNSFKERWYMRHKHDIAFYHPQQNMVVELHFRLSYLGLDFFPMTAITRSPIRLLNASILAPDDDYHVLYLMIHGAIHAWIRLRWLQDIALFIYNNQCDLQHVHDLAKQINCQHVVEQTLMLVNEMFKIEHIVLTQLIKNPDHRAPQLAMLAKEFISTDYEATDGMKNPRMFFKYRIYLAKLAANGQKCHAILGDLFKLDELFNYVTFPDKLSFMYYIFYPLWVIKFILKSMRNQECNSRV